MAKPDLIHEAVNGRTYWFSPSMPAAEEASPTAYLLPAYDEYAVAYKDRGAVLDPSDAKRASSGNGIFNPIMVLDGQVVGTWKRTLGKTSVAITFNPFTSLKKTETNAFIRAARRYGEFLELSVVLA